MLNTHRSTYLIEHKLNHINRNSYSNTPSSYPLNYFAVIGEIYGYMEITMRAVIAFQLTIGKRENPFRHSETGLQFFFLFFFFLNIRPLSVPVPQAGRLLSNFVRFILKNAIRSFRFLSIYKFARAIKTDRLEEKKYSR